MAHEVVIQFLQCLNDVAGEVLRKRTKVVPSGEHLLRLNLLVVLLVHQQRSSTGPPPVRTGRTMGQKIRRGGHLSSTGKQNQEDGNTEGCVDTFICENTVQFVGALETAKGIKNRINSFEVVFFLSYSLLLWRLGASTVLQVLSYLHYLLYEVLVCIFAIFASMSILSFNTQTVHT